jgi:hypothetical protein
MRHPKYVVREIVLRDHLLTKKTNYFFIFLFSPPQHLSYVVLLRYHHWICLYGLVSTCFWWFWFNLVIH